MKTVRVYIETTIHGPAAPQDGKYAAALVFTKQSGEVKDLFVQGEEAETTYNRSVLLAMIRAFQRFREPCHIIFYTENSYIKNMIQADNPEKWRRSEWKKSDGKDIQNKELWQLFLEEKDKHEVEVVWKKDSEYKQTLQAVMRGEEI